MEHFKNFLINDEKLENKINHLSTQNKTLKNQINDLSTQNKTFENHINDLSTQNKTFENQINDLSTQNKTLKNQIDTVCQIINATFNRDNFARDLCTCGPARPKTCTCFLTLNMISRGEGKVQHDGYGSSHIAEGNRWEKIKEVKNWKI